MLYIYTYVCMYVYKVKITSGHWKDLFTIYIFHRQDQSSYSLYYEKSLPFLTWSRFHFRVALTTSNQIICGIQCLWTIWKINNNNNKLIGQPISIASSVIINTYFTSFEVNHLKILKFVNGRQFTCHLVTLVIKLLSFIDFNMNKNIFTFVHYIFNRFVI